LTESLMNWGILIINFYYFAQFCKNLLPISSKSFVRCTLVSDGSSVFYFQVCDVIHKEI
jgi:hypothetical protein